MEHDLNILMIFGIKMPKWIILTHTVYCWLLLQIYLCCLWLVSCSRVTHVITLCRCWEVVTHCVHSPVLLYRRQISVEAGESQRIGLRSALEAAVPEASHRSSVSSKSLTHTCSYPSVHTALMCDTLSLFSAQYRQVKRGSLGAVTMSQLMKRQLEHQSSVPQNISTWDTGQSYISTFLLSLPSITSLPSH